MQNVVIFLFVFFSSNCYSQYNIVPNSSFELYSALPSYATQWDRCLNWNNGYGQGSPDYFHVNGSGIVQLPACYAAYVNPHTGRALMGLLTWSDTPQHENWREYISCKMSQPMILGVPYRISYWVTNGESNHLAGYSSNRLGFNLSVDSCIQFWHNPIEITPTYELSTQLWNTEWQEMQFDFVADSNYQYLTIGNFHGADSTISQFQVQGTYPYDQAYYFFDDVSITHLLPDMCVSDDITICAGDSTILISQNGVFYQWFNSNDLSTCISTDSSISVFPQVTTNYTVIGAFDTLNVTVIVYPPQPNLPSSINLCRDSILEISGTEYPDVEYLWSNGDNTNTTIVNEPGIYTLEVSHMCGSSHDTVEIIQYDCVTIVDMPNVFTPNGDQVNDVFKAIILQGTSEEMLQIFDRWGNLMFESKSPFLYWDGNYKKEKCSNGTYFYKLQYLDFQGISKCQSGFFNFFE